MKAAEFDYICPASVPEVCRLLAEANDDARIIAGGQSLVPLMAMRLARPGLLIDINRISGLRGIELSDGIVAVKACTRQADALASAIVREHVPLLAKALPFVGHSQTRNRGTVGGSLANADPAAEIAIVALALDCEIVARGVASERTIAATQFFRGAMRTALAPEDCLTEARFPVWREEGRIGMGFQEVSIRRSDFALVAVAVQILLDESGICRRIAIALGGLSAAPIRAHAAAKRLEGTRLEPSDLEAATGLLQESIEPQSDIHASAAYRRRVAGALLERAILEAWHEARPGKV